MLILEPQTNDCKIMYELGLHFVKLLQLRTIAHTTLILWTTKCNRIEAVMLSFRFSISLLLHFGFAVNSIQYLFFYKFQ